MRHAIERARGQLRAGGTPSAVLLIDVCGLDAAGEEPAAALAERLTAALHDEDIVGRFGGDVLVVVARDVADDDAAHELAARLVAAIAPSFGGAARNATAGVTLVHSAEPPVAAVVARADAALYAAKNKASRDARRDVAEPREGRAALVESAFERSTVEDFDVSYQPIVDLRDGSIAAVEAILRWEHPDLGTIAPSEFLAIARSARPDRDARPLDDRQGVRADRALGRYARRPADAHVRQRRAGAGRSTRRSPRTSCRRSRVTARRRTSLRFELTEEALDAIPAGLVATLAEARLELILDHEGTSVPSSELLATSADRDDQVRPRARRGHRLRGGRVPARRRGGSAEPGPAVRREGRRDARAAARGAGVRRAVRAGLPLLAAAEPGGDRAARVPRAAVRRRCWRASRCCSASTSTPPSRRSRSALPRFPSFRRRVRRRRPARRRPGSRAPRAAARSTAPRRHRPASCRRARR